MSKAPIPGILALAVSLVLMAACGPVRDPGAVAISHGVADSAEGAIIVEADGYTYKIPLDVSWTEQNGTHHGGDRPGCLPPGALVPIGFAWVEVTAGGATWREVVWVDCGG